MSIVISNAFKVIEGRPVTSSRIVAEYFGKQHHHVVRDIRSLIEQKPSLEASANFGEWSEEVEIGSGAKRTVTGYWMDQKGFCILAMGFTGTKALEFKSAFYDEFERMKHELEGRTAEPTTLSTEEQYEIRKAVKSRAKNSSIHYQTIYNALYDYFKVASYKDLTKGQLQAALTFIHTCEIKPQLPQPEIPEGSAVITKVEAECLLGFVYCLHYLFRPQLKEFERFLRLVDSPLAPDFWDLLNEVHFFTVEGALERNGYSVKEMSCYKHLMARRKQFRYS